MDDEPDYFTDYSRDSINVTATDLGLEIDLVIKIIWEFERQFDGADPSHEYDEACLATYDNSIVLEVREITKLLESACYQLTHLVAGITALDSLAERNDHVGHMAPLWALLLATDPEHALNHHEQCREACILNHTMVRLLIASCTDDSETIDALAHDPCVLVRQAARARDDSDRSDRSSLVARAANELKACGSGCDDGFLDLAANLARSSLMIPLLPAAIQRDVRAFGVWHWATHPSPTPAQDYFPAGYEHLHGPVLDQFSVSHGGHGINSWSLNLRLAAGNFALASQTLWGGVITGAPNSNPAWSDMCDVASIVAEAADEEWLPRTYRPREWLITYSDFRETQFAPTGTWGLTWIGDGDPPHGLSQRSTALTPFQMLRLIEKIEAAAG